MANNARYLLGALIKRGPSFLVLYLRESLLFDLRHGTNTHLRVPKSEVNAADDRDKQNGLLYVASLTSVVREALTACRALIGHASFIDAQFMDLGCGKGKALLVYATEFARDTRRTAIGIEYDDDLCQIARRNVIKVCGPSAGVAVHLDSAVNFERYIEGESLIVYLYNSFQGATLRAVLSGLAKYPHLLIYVDPPDLGILQEFGYRIHTDHRGRYHANTWLIAANPARTL